MMTVDFIINLPESLVLSESGMFLLVSGIA